MRRQAGEPPSGWWWWNGDEDDSIEHMDHDTPDYEREHGHVLAELSDLMIVSYPDAMTPEVHIMWKESK